MIQPLLLRFNLTLVYTSRFNPGARCGWKTIQYHDGVFTFGQVVAHVSSSSLVFHILLVRNLGELVATHRKVHLFDIDIPGKITFKACATESALESSTDPE